MKYLYLNHLKYVCVKKNSLGSFILKYSALLMILKSSNICNIHPFFLMLPKTYSLFLYKKGLI